MKKKRRLPFPILFEDDDVIVIDKPAGLLTTHTKLVGRLARESQLTAENILNDYVRKGQAKSRKRVWLVHRLDRETSGVMMFAKSEEIAEKFRAEWASLTEKTYRARVGGLLEEEGGAFESYLLEDADGYRVRSVRVGLGTDRVRLGSDRVALGSDRVRLGTDRVGLGFDRVGLGSDRVGTALKDPKATLKDAKDPKTRIGKFARTEWRRLSTTAGTTLVEVKLRTGRKNQIRVHFSEAGHPVIGDEKYGGERASRLYLHALSLRFRHPRTGEWLEFTAPPPRGFW